MAWTTGELITAGKLNSENADRGIVLDTGGISNSSASVGPVYLHSSSNYFRCWQQKLDAIPLNAGSTGTFTVKKLENGYWVDKKTISLSSSWPNNHKTELIYNSWGAGWYKLLVSNSNYGLAWGDGRSSGSVFPWRTDNIRGDFLRYYDSPQNSGNPYSVGKPITTDMLNTGYVMTTPVL